MLVEAIRDDTFTLCYVPRQVEKSLLNQSQYAERLWCCDESAKKEKRQRRWSKGTEHIDNLVLILTSQCHLRQPLIFLSLPGFCLTPGDDLMIS